MLLMMKTNNIIYIIHKVLYFQLLFYNPNINQCIIVIYNKKRMNLMVIYFLLLLGNLVILYIKI